jgi:hypothetical protein
VGRKKRWESFLPLTNKMKTMPEDDTDKERNNLLDKELVPLNI